MVGIISFGCYIPKYRLKAEDIAKANGSSNDSFAGLGVTEKSVPGIDEDTITISTEAAKNALNAASIDPKQLGAIFIGSESHPYAVKPTGTVVAQAIGMGNNYMTADLQFACKAGTAGMQIIYAMVKSGLIEQGIAGGADTAQAAPGDALEYTAAAGGACFVIGKDPAVSINATLSFSSDTPDFWRRQHEKFPAHGGQFTGEPAYFHHITSAAKNLMGKAGTKPSDYTYAIFHQPNGKFPLLAASKLGFTESQIKLSLIVTKIGNTYSGSSLLGLCAVLEKAKRGDRIIMVSYGSGAGSDAFDMTVEKAIPVLKGHTIQDYIQDKIYIDYSRYLKFTGQI
ncbi:MAG: hydroxymethylglutaryl-CoA synthase [Nanoarchaeota archaeon]|nr:hydroxymethylglutaryl-CoA synthase [Nanoarchaeota archaeon]